MGATGETAISRIVRILTAFERGDASLTVTEIARRSELPVPTAHRLVGELVRWRLLERGPDKQVRIGLRLWELSVRSSSQLFLRDRALPYMEDLHAAVRQHTQLWVLDDVDMVCVERLSSKGSAVSIVRVAARIPASVSAPGLVFAAFSSDRVRESILGSLPSPLTPLTPRSTEALMPHVVQARHTGLAVAEGWIHPDATGMAVPIRGPGGGPVAALSLIVPSGSEAIRTAAPALHAAALGISRAVSASGEAHRDPRLALLEHLVRSETVRFPEPRVPGGPAVE